MTLHDSGAQSLVFENFYAYLGFDLAGFGFDFTPNGMGGYFVTGIDCAFASAVSVGTACAPTMAGTTPLELIAVAPPALGGSFDLSLVGIPTSSQQAAIFLGMANPMLDLSLVFTGVPCTLMSDNSFGTLNLSATGWMSGMTTANLSISLAGVSPALIGLPLVAQGVIVDPSLPWVSTLPIATSNAIEAVVGN